MTWICSAAQFVSIVILCITKLILGKRFFSQKSGRFSVAGRRRRKETHHHHGRKLEFPDVVSYGTITRKRERSSENVAGRCPRSSACILRGVGEAPVGVSDSV